MTQRVKDLLARAVQRLVEVRDSTAQLDAEVILRHKLDLSRAELYARLNDEVDDHTSQEYYLLVERRAQGEPVAYITNTREFMALDFYVDKRVLVPRPETELLVEFSINKLQEKGWMDQEIVLVDVGTGSGIIAVYLAVRFPHLHVYATDISDEALEVAAINARRHGVAERIKLLHGNLIEPLDTKPNIIISNPPYTVIAQVEPNVARFEPNIALDGGPKGLAIFRELFTQAKSGLTRPGFIALEIGADQANDVQNLSKHFFPGSHVEIHKDYAGLDRVVIIEVEQEITPAITETQTSI
ncbi:MAG: peptide chain release factor N(5)-glutamine methyltransferase [Chloroflexi bacterium]|uniref:Release factor glutamine methyltransferase n=1 Tax=Candidatus Chlorohelix allophototropha TaxID=3003348 RepID=A0A8T7M1E2_9CHLR|nr:peptide chain release factor N(5)-glutamine methyltransferase [Chloroflexota bacterium]WJW66399.1 peptide chain release factor N(5)-glutamine methyltransferase [Chloroflexota bacterium L227-S17]